ncbi:IS110 family RNA-guided transposase [Planococcus salinarum]|uniref:IS110 family transposase n=1 Tax=Planococcus salinarum TaxID=622695 RepID=UPI000E3E087F|nr:IS110 family transposase [Planococcus salinarum]TAA65644.1 IS110 family transposase [Planococcus salinarum]
MNFVIAFDVSMGKSNLVVYDHNHHCHFEGELEHTQAGFRALKQRINAIQEQAGHLPAIVFEATGVYSSPLERFLKSNDYPYSRLNPLEAKLQTAAMRRQKTDIGDAHELAKSHYRVVRQETFQQADYYDQLRGLGRYCEDIEKEISQHNNRLHAFLQMSFPLVEKVFARSSALFLNIVQLFPHPAYLVEVSKEELLNHIKQATRKRMSEQEIEKKATLLLAAAENSYPSIGPGDVRCQHLKNYAERLLELRTQKKEVIKQMVALSKDRVEFQVLKSFPGIGDQTAVQVISELGDIRRFQNAKQINAYIGIDIRRHQSGKLQYQDKINKRGNKRLRKILYFMVMNMLSKRKKASNTIVDHYDQLKKQPNGKPHQVAVIACVNKFVKVAFHLIQHGLLFHYESGKAS